MGRREPENCVQIHADMVYVDGIPVAVLFTETAPATLVEAFRRCVDSKDFSKAVFQERNAGYPKRRA